MKTLTQLLENHYINSIEELEKLLESKEQKTLNVDLENSNSNLKEFKHIVLIGEMKYTSLRDQNIKLDYADPTKLEYTITDEKIKVDDGEYKFELEEKDKYDTIVFVRSGYKNPTISFLLKEIIKMGITVINNPEYVSLSSNKYLTALLFSKYNIPQPKYVLITSSDIHKGEHEKFDKKLHTIYKEYDDNTKFVCKLLNGHGGKGVFICRGSNILSVIQCIFAINNDVPILVQEYLKIKDGDIRAHIITMNKKQVVLDASMRINNGKDFRTNLSLGNSQKKYTLTEEQEKIAFNAAAVSGLIWAGVDLLTTENNKTYVLEINGAPGSPAEIESDQLKEINTEFYKKFIDTINSLC